MSKANNTTTQFSKCIAVKRVLNKGQKLRSAIVKSILDYDDTTSVLPQHHNKENERQQETNHTLPSSKSCGSIKLPQVPLLPLAQINDSSTRTTTTANQVEDTGSKEVVKVTPSSIGQYLPHIDSLKLTVHSMNLNQAGNRKVTSSTIDQKYKLPVSVSHMYFVKYSIPKQLHVNRRTRINSLNEGDVRICCTKRISSEGIPFNHTEVHQVTNLDKFQLKDVYIRFEISCRTLKQKSTNILGISTFSLQVLEQTKSLWCTQELPILDKAIILGSLRVSFYLGSDQLYFGREFVDFFYLNGKDTRTVCGDENEVPSATIETIITSNNTSSKDNNDNCDAAITTELLHGLVFISEADYYSEAINSYVSCQLFCQNEVVCSRVVFNSRHPVFNFYQKVPLLYNEEFLQLVQSNSMVLEFWEEKNHREQLLRGTTRISLRAFYIAYKDRAIVKSLFKKKLPVIVADWCELITNPLTGGTFGQVKILVALGFDNQIRNLEVERGLRNDRVNVSYITTTSKPVEKLKSVDIGVQSEIESISMESEKSESTQRLLQRLLSQLTAQQTKPDLPGPIPPQAHSTNQSSITESRVNTNLQIKRTSDLLDELNGALGFDVPTKSTNTKGIEEKTFKSQVVIEEALHLPGRNKYKNKKTRRKEQQTSGSCGTYVSFEVSAGALEFTQVSPKLSNPTWNYRRDVNLPLELIYNSQKRFILKVWRKKNDQSPNSHNPQEDQVVGFAACDLSGLAAGLPTIQGWYNVVDFENKCKGQIKIAVTPIDKIVKVEQKLPESITHVDSETNSSQQTGELLSSALKRKFVELDEITERLRARLADITTDKVDNDDNLTQEFENDINTQCVESDGEDAMWWCNSANEPTTSNRNSHSTLPFSPTTPTESHLVKEKQHIDTLLQKLTLLSNADSAFVNCLTERREETAEANENIFNSSLFQQLCSAPLDSLQASSRSNDDDDDEDVSLLTQFSLFRKAPEGNNSTDESHKQN